MTPLGRLLRSFYCCSTVTMALSCIVSEIKRDIDRKSRFSYHLCIWRPTIGQFPFKGKPKEFRRNISYAKTRMAGLFEVKIAHKPVYYFFVVRGIYCDRPCRDVVGRLVVGWLLVALCWWIVAKRCVVGLGYSYCWTLIGNHTFGIQWYHFQPPTSVASTWDVGSQFWNSGAFLRISTATFASDERCYTQLRPSQVINNTQRWSLCTALEWGAFRCGHLFLFMYT